MISFSCLFMVLYLFGENNVILIDIVDNYKISYYFIVY